MSDGYVKDRECLYCSKFFECKGKPSSELTCINFEKAKENEKYEYGEDSERDKLQSGN